VVTADDAGLRDGWDEAIRAAHAAGVVTAVSVATNGPSYARARTMFGGPSGPEAGVHLNVLDGAPLSPTAEVRTLVDGAGRFGGAPWRFLARYAAARIDRAQVVREWERQLERAAEDDLRPTHLNSHYHLHLLPGLFEPVVELARRFGIRWVRVADEPPWPPTAWIWPPWSLPKAAGLRWASRGCRDLLARAGLDAGVACRGTTASGRLGGAAWAAMLRALGPGATEVVCHPGQSDQETAALTSPELRSELRRRARVCGFRELAVGA
jgi:predicted glycoside hydrolase/deacetylase ChbG (UPF0249 family)